MQECSLTAVKWYCFLSGKDNTGLTILKLSSYLSFLKMILCQVERRVQFNIPRVLLAMGKTIVQKSSIICNLLGFCFVDFFLKKIELVLCRRLLKIRIKIYICVISRQKCFFTSVLKQVKKKLRWKSIQKLQLLKNMSYLQNSA